MIVLSLRDGCGGARKVILTSRKGSGVDYFYEYIESPCYDFRNLDAMEGL